MFDTVREAGGPPSFANYTWIYIYIANLFVNRSRSRTLVCELSKSVHELFYELLTH